MSAFIEIVIVYSNDRMDFLFVKINRIGAPTREVKIPTGNSMFGTSLIAPRSAFSNNIPPMKKDPSIENLRSAPRIFFEICGEIRPMNPRMPTLPIADAVITVPTRRSRLRI